MTSVVYVTNVQVGANPAPVAAPFEFQVSLETTQALQEDLEWRLIYVGSAENKAADQELDSVSLGPIPRGKLQFTFVADPPDFTKIVQDEIPGITVVLLSGCYKNQEFVRIGWYLHNVFTHVPLDEQAEVDADSMTLNEMLPKLQRIILADNPRITRFNIEWDSPLPATSAVVPSTAAAAATTASATMQSPAAEMMIMAAAAAAASSSSSSTSSCGQTISADTKCSPVQAGGESTPDAMEDELQYKLNC